MSATGTLKLVLEILKLKKKKRFCSRERPIQDLCFPGALGFISLGVLYPFPHEKHVVNSSTIELLSKGCAALRPEKVLFFF